MLVYVYTLHCRRATRHSDNVRVYTYYLCFALRDNTDNKIESWDLYGQRIINDEIAKALERDNFMTAEEAKDFGLIDKVVEKRV